jgi:hypothetical protein
MNSEDRSFDERVLTIMLTGCSALPAFLIVKDVGVKALDSFLIAALDERLIVQVSRVTKFELNSESADFFSVTLDDRVLNADFLMVVEELNVLAPIFRTVKLDDSAAK